MLPAALHASVACVCVCALSSVIVLKLARKTHTNTHTHIHTDIHFTLQACAGCGKGQSMGSVNSRRPDKMTCVRPRSWHCNCVCMRVCVCVSVCVCICWSVSVVCTEPTLLFTVGDFRRIVGSWQAPLLSFFFFLNLLVSVCSSALCLSVCLPVCLSVCRSAPHSLAPLMCMWIWCWATTTV